MIQLSTKDVIHSFNMPHMRVKQDALPGKIIPVWFKPINSNVEAAWTAMASTAGWTAMADADSGEPEDTSKVWQIACAELCGWGHYRDDGPGLMFTMTEADFLEWLEAAAAPGKRFRQNQVRGAWAGTLALKP